MDSHRRFRSWMIAVGLLLWVGALFGACTDDSNTSASGSGGAGGSGGEGGGDCMVNGQLCPGVCDPNLGCVECLEDADCDADASICVAGGCEECGDNSDCPAGESCYPESHECNDACSDNNDCTQDEALTCDTETGACVGCLTNADCSGPDAEGPLCSPLTKQCVECASNAECEPDAPICNIEDGFCEECLLDAQCGPGEICSDSECIAGCSSNAECSDEGKPLCDTTAGRCVECLLASDCDAEVPVCDDGECVVCASNADCSDAELPYCDEGDACVECLDDEHCDPGFMCDNEICMAAG